VETDRGDVSFPVLGDSRKLTRLCSAYRIDLVVICITHQRSDELAEEIYQLRKSGFTVEEMPAVYEKLFQKIPVYHMGHHFYSFEGEIQLEQGAFFVRLYNIFIALILLVLYAILAFPLVYVLTRRTIGKKVFFVQQRIGLWDEPFDIYKIKTMKDDVPAPNREGLPWATRNDPRVPRSSRLIRDLKLDEFPQLWNVVRGDMNLIGPRPQMKELLERFEKAIPYYSRRHLVRPGITGWAQINHSALRSTEDAIEGLQFDLYYVKHRDLFFDLYILFRTVERVLKVDRI
jgi:lipopolysaccharide/colanic/teichoic acid biosynthesis glycosyltransferase